MNDCRENNYRREKKRVEDNGRRGRPTNRPHPLERPRTATARLPSMLHHPVARRLPAERVPELRGDHADEAEPGPRRGVHDDAL